MSGPIDLQKSLRINSAREVKKIIEFVKRRVSDLKRDGAVIGLSGGLDSTTCAYILEAALGPENVLALILPERDSAEVNMEHARMVARTLKLKTLELDITESLGSIGVYDIGPNALDEEGGARDLEKRFKLASKLFGKHIIFNEINQLYGREKSGLFYKVLSTIFAQKLHDRTAFAFTKVRMRMLYLYHYAWRNNFSIIGTTDKSEFSIGLFDPHGDGACEIQLLRHLYKTQIRQLAMDIGVPEEIIGKPSSGDLYGNVAWEKVMGFTYEQLDQILLGLEKGIKAEKLTHITDLKSIEIVKRSIETSNLMKSLPYALE